MNTKNQTKKNKVNHIISFKNGDIKKLYQAIQNDMNDQRDTELKHLKLEIGRELSSFRRNINLTIQEFSDTTGIEITTIILAERGLLSEQDLSSALSVIDHLLATSFETSGPQRMELQNHSSQISAKYRYLLDYSKSIPYNHE